MNKAQKYNLKLKRLGIDTYKEAILYLKENCPVCRSEGFVAQARISVNFGDQFIVATLNIIQSDLLMDDEASLSEYAWELLGVKEGDTIGLSHPKPLVSLSYIRKKVYGNVLNNQEISTIINDVLYGRLSDIHIASFITACAGGRLNISEIRDLTKAMISSGECLHWHSKLVVDKHCVGGLPGNRTSLIIVPIVAAFGLTIPKTSSRAITSPAGTADTMEVFAPVELNIKAMRKVVEQENGCIIWGGAISLSPTDDLLIRIERALDLDSEGQLIASVLSKKIAAGSTHTVIDIPVGPTAKVRDLETANGLKKNLEIIGKELGLTVRALLSDGSQPIGRGIGPCLEAKDVLSVLQNHSKAPQDLREHSLQLAGAILEFSNTVKPGTGEPLAREILDSGKAFEKFQAICLAQGGFNEPKKARFCYTIVSGKSGVVEVIDNRRLAQIAKLAGAPHAKAAGLELQVSIGSLVEKGQPLYTIYSETKGELQYALSYKQEKKQTIYLRETE